MRGNAIELDPIPSGLLRLFLVIGESSIVDL